MKKRLLSLFLALCLLGSLVACSDYGEFYTEDEFLQNTLIQCVITDTGPRRVAYEIRNETSYLINTDPDETILQIRRDGAWVQAPIDEDYVWIKVDREPLGWSGICKEVYSGNVAFGYYKPLHPGEYRIIVKMEAKKDRYAAEIEELYATAYFTLTDEVYGTFETKDGILQNTNVILHITGEDLNAPVVDLSHYLENKSAFDIEQQRYAADNNYDYLLEILEDGVWKEAPTFGEIIHEEVVRKDFWKKEQIKGGAAELMDKRYVALDPGEYRVRVKYAIIEAIEGVEIPAGQLEAVGYFTVTAPAE